MRRRLGIWLAMLLWAAAASAATTHYVDGSCGSSGTGATTTCGASGPWKTLANINCASLGTDDIVEIRAGFYRESWQPAGACDGTAGHPHIFQNYLNEAVIIDGTTEHAGETWTQVATGVWQSATGSAGLTSTTWPYAGWYIPSGGTEANDEVQVVIEQNHSTTPGGQSGSHTYTCNSSFPTSGHMTYDGSNNTLCVHLPTGANPVAAGASFKTPLIYQLVDLFDGGISDYLTVRKNPSGGSFTIRRATDYDIQTTTGVGLTFDGLNVYGAGNRCISMVSASASGNQLLNSSVHDCGQELVHWPDTGTGNLIQNNLFYDAGDPVNWLTTADPLHNYVDGVTGVRFSAQNGTFRGNTVWNVGGGGFFFPFARLVDQEGPRSNNLYENNLLYGGPSSPGVSGGSIGLVIGGQGGTVSNNTIRNNRLWDLDIGLQFNGDSGTETGSGNVVQNNTIGKVVTAGTQMRASGTWNADVVFTNNVYIESSGSALAYDNAGGYTVNRPTYGAYYCPGCTTIINSWGGATASNSQGSVTSYEANSQYGDPNLSTSGSPPTLQIVSASGSAYNHGSTIGTFSVDYLGTSRPQFVTWDCGAHEFSGSSDTPTPTNTPVNTPTPTPCLGVATPNGVSDTAYQWCLAACANQTFCQVFINNTPQPTWPASSWTPTSAGCYSHPVNVGPGDSLKIKCCNP